MVIVRLSGGLGNQMFQYAMGRALALRKADTLRLDPYGLLDRHPIGNDVHREFDLGVFDIVYDFASRDEIRRVRSPGWRRGYRLRRLLGLDPHVSQRVVREECWGRFSPKAANHRGSGYFEGYWQCEKYFKSAETTIRKDFTVITRMPPPMLEVKNRILSTPEAVCVSVRRGDYVAHPLHDIWTDPLVYYRDAEAVVRTRTGASTFFVFSDDVAWCRANLRFHGETYFVDHDSTDVKFSRYLDLMSCCRHFIIPNSTFPWWAAWLCPHPDKIVIAPKRWFADPKADAAAVDIVPEGWLRV